MHYPKNISFFTIGVVVEYTRDTGAGGNVVAGDIGHVVGFTLNSTEEVLVVVRFPRHTGFGKDERIHGHTDIPLHPSCIKLLMA